MPPPPSTVSAVSASWPLPATKVPSLWTVLKQIADLMFMCKAKFRFISLEREELKTYKQYYTSPVRTSPLIALS